MWAEAAPELIPLPLRGHDRCNGLEPFGYRPGYTLLWALIQDVYWDDQRAQLIGEVSETFGRRLAERLAATGPPEHRVLSRRLARWLEQAPREHGPLLVDAVLGRPGAVTWTRAAIRPCPRCGFPPAPRTWQAATSPYLLPDAALHGAHGTRPEALTVHQKEEAIDR